MKTSFEIAGILPTCCLPLALLLISQGDQILAAETDDARSSALPFSWEPGPGSPIGSSDTRPPNIMLILADDLGWKISFFEGGIHVPYFIKWPDRIPAGSQYDSPVAHIDIFSTALAAAGIDLPTDRVTDGVNILQPALQENQPPLSRRITGAAKATRWSSPKAGNYRYRSRTAGNGCTTSMKIRLNS